MKTGWFRARKSVGLALCAGAALTVAAATWWHWREPSLESLAEQVRGRVAAIRGREFRQPTKVRQITQEQARAFLREQLAPLPKLERYWAIMRTLGLYRGPDREAPEVLFEELFDLAAGAYDASRDEMLVLWKLDQAGREVLLSHELCHALQDQHFDLDRYLLNMARDPAASADELLARQSVVEGDATYVDALYQAQAAGIPRPSREQMATLLTSQVAWRPEQWESWASQPDLDGTAREQLRRAIDARGRLPPFLFELFMAAYIDGAKFIHAIHERGWAEVDRLYVSQPPISTEQILHPEKWRAREDFARIEWPRFDERFAGWQLLHENSLGERQWQALFRAQGLPGLAEPASAGWNGDRFAVFKRRDRDDMLLLMVTVWDSPAEAAEFAQVYRRLQAAKFDSPAVPVHLVLEEQVVWIVEGGDADNLPGFAAFNASAMVRFAPPNSRTSATP
jgi:hypothetical protein